MGTASTVARAVVALLVGAVAAAAAWFVFVRYPTGLSELLGVVLVVVAAVAGLRLGGSLAGRLAAPYNVAEVAVEGPITRDSGGGPLPSSPTAATADDIVDQVERADEDSGVDALLVKLNTPGGEIVPSEDIRLAVERFDGPAVGYATDLCASGGYDIASGCDELWAREGTLVGSIGVIGSRVNVHDLADRLGVSYEQFTAGEYKDAGTPLKRIEEDERAYIQGLVDDYYDQFVETVAEGRDLDPDAVADTEARVYLGERAADIGLVDELGPRRDVEDALEERLGEPVTVEEFQPQRGLGDRLQLGARRVAAALGAGAAATLDGDIDGIRFRR
ncbi:signal peptide peptidase SppA [Halobacteriales archaeon QS_4_69_31]|nr:MAG: signal peptide peptidase SppA [Halobacteriales archaeon QS_4_69_31]